MHSEAGELSVGAVVDPGALPRWQHTLLEGLARLPGCTLSARAEGPEPRQEGRGPSRLFRRYESWDRAHFETPSDALAPVEPPALVAGGPAEQPLDLILWLSERPLPERSPDGVTHGVWYVRHGAARADRDAPLFAEVRAGNGTVVTSLCALVDDREHVLLSSVGPSDPVSLHRSRARAYARAAQLPLRRLGRVGPAPAGGGKTRAPSPQPPSVIATAATLARLGWRILGRKLSVLLFEPRWMIAYRRLGEQESALSLAGSFDTLRPPPGRAFADPFPVDDPSGDALFFEDFRSGRGEIGAAALDPDRGVGRPERVLSRDTHLSYPFLMRDGDGLFLVPESRQAERVELLRSTAFPLEWRHERVLLDGLPATDSTLFRHEGRVWLFATLASDADAAVDELHLFSADGLGDEWVPHPANPVVCDVRSARPAGALFRYGDQLMRPAQDCSRAYGWRVVLNRVETMNESEYRETPVGRIEPVGRSVTRVHTYNASGRWETLDALWLAPRFLRRAGPSSVRFRLVRYPSWR